MIHGIFLKKLVRNTSCDRASQRHQQRHYESRDKTIDIKTIDKGSDKQNQGGVKDKIEQSEGQDREGQRQDKKYGFDREVKQTDHKRRYDSNVQAVNHNTRNDMGCQQKRQGYH